MNTQAPARAGTRYSPPRTRKGTCPTRNPIQNYRGQTSNASNISQHLRRLGTYGLHFTRTPCDTITQQAAPGREPHLSMECSPTSNASSPTRSCIDPSLHFTSRVFVSSSGRPSSPNSRRPRLSRLCRQRMMFVVNLNSSASYTRDDSRMMQHAMAGEDRGGVRSPSPGTQTNNTRDGSVRGPGLQGRKTTTVITTAVSIHENTRDVPNGRRILGGKDNMTGGQRPSLLRPERPNAHEPVEGGVSLVPGTTPGKTSYGGIDGQACHPLTHPNPPGATHDAS